MAGKTILGAPMAEEIKYSLSEIVYPVVDLYQHYFFLGSLHKLWSAITRCPNRLHILGQDGFHFQSSRYDGLREVFINRIHGSESRNGDFDNHFHPISENTRERWQSIARAHYSEVGLPPVELIQVDEIYYVRDGHHRISVALALGILTIDAEVTVLNLAN